MSGDRLVLLPGLGADGRLFERQAEALGPSLVRPPLPPARRGESLAAYAARLAPAIRERVEGASSVRLGGMSFGAQVAMVLARHVPCDEVLVISGCPDPAAMPPNFGRRRRVGRLLPAPLVRAVLPTVARLFARGESLDPADAELLRAIARDVDPATLHELAATCERWSDEDLAHLDRGPGSGDIPVRRLHGRHDRVIPLVIRKHDRTRTTVIEDGRHLIQLTHADAVSAWLRATTGPRDDACFVARGRERATTVDRERPDA